MPGVPRCGAPAANEGELCDGRNRVGNLADFPVTPEGRTCVGVVYGGPSAEHEVSAAAALAVIRGLRATRFRSVAIGIGRDGCWRLPPVRAVEEAVAARPDGPAIRDRLTAEGVQVEIRHGGRLVSSRFATS
ncbi:hypothetical protein [Streptomyces mirabilis]|uniref:hypothetical protein n=1 Tax=Streptomyces mirabilis TaxID=68239 RepID=UPI00352EB4FB